MYEELNQRLDESRQGMDKYKHLGSKLSDCRKQLNELESKRVNLKQQFLKEEEDYNSLFKKSLNNLILELLNKKEKKEAKEYQEIAAARVKLDEAEKQIAALLLTIRSLEEERVNLSSCESTYRKLYEEKYRLLSESDPENSGKIKAAEEKIHFCEKNLTEINEAIGAGTSVIAKVREAEESLDSAHSWGTYDLLGGGLISDVIKHSRLDDAQDSINEVQSLLHQFHSELADIQMDEEINVQIDGFTKFADYFFDGVFSDWMVQSKINSSIDAVADLETKVDRVLNQLKSLKSSTESSLSQAKLELENIIKNS
ncbi:hypothetical protein SAMN02745136_04806 [Anaerocolumna jejuensis DSM 15929]|uniref:Uncharacterized protein n=1 Tax=Anaerocolumna jejuensis DSM 15929 TaxID=1121322 RepID=A0A1M7ABV8_9FIRM|nr:hypothetical protein [Anaerocolumna jejuensis]SHL40217.1 hypothetical protein SAMN02745136_04806 [Anaerocolumna jejuensis DSM 15929]